uniref:Uncharacterized protein n=1 Tax=Hyaloperonospora arabidopsidis (strain Emoy2) TaxID=559515 RepID=M4BZZ1_HYAAE
MPLRCRLCDVQKVLRLSGSRCALLRNVHPASSTHRTNDPATGVVSVAGGFKLYVWIRLRLLEGWSWGPTAYARCENGFCAKTFSLPPFSTATIESVATRSFIRLFWLLVSGRGSHYVSRDS